MSTGSSSADCNEILSLRLEVGHESVLLGPPRISYPGAHTHKWTIFVRGQNGTTLDTNLIQKVIFHLHDDFQNPKRAVSNPPFEVCETGYGGFIIPIYILFANSKREQYFEYDMNLKYSEYDKNTETKVIEFRDPKPELRAKLLKAGAEISSSKSSKTKRNGGNFRELFGETLDAPSPSAPIEKPKPPPPVTNTNTKRQGTSSSSSSSSSGDNSSTKVKYDTCGKTFVAPTSAAASSSSSSQSGKKNRKPKEAGQTAIIKNMGDKSGEESYAAHCLAAAKLPPFVSPLSECTWPGISESPSTSNAGRDDLDETESTKSKKSDKSSIQRSPNKVTVSHLSPGGQNSKRVQNGTRIERQQGGQGKKKRKKTKSDSGLDSDYSSGMPNANSPCVANGQLISGAASEQNGRTALFSPPDSVRSLDTLQESPVSAVSCCSGRSGASSTNPPTGRLKNGGEDDPGPSTSSNIAVSINDEDRLRMLLILQQKIMTIREKRLAQLVADMISAQATDAYHVTSDCMQFDLFNLDTDLIQRLINLLDLQL